MGYFKDMPSDGKGATMSEKDGNRIMHVTLPISKETCLMGSDIIDISGVKIIQGNNYSVSINAESKAEADKLFKGLSAGGKVIMPMEKTFWGAYFGMFADKFGINWMVNFDEPQEH